MARGGHGNSGPPPDPNALRRDRKDDGGWVDLPAAGRSDPPPAWPLSKATKRERELWEREWARPQALMWEANGQEVEVALYVRAVRMAEKPGAPTSLRNSVIRQQEALGVSIPGLRRHRWRIVEKTNEPRRRTSGSSAKERLKLVQGGGA